MQHKPIHDVAPMPVSSLPVKAEPDRQMIGVRIERPTYRRLKAHVVLNGATVQDFVERAITEFLRSQTAA